MRQEDGSLITLPPTPAPATPSSMTVGENPDIPSDSGKVPICPLLTEGCETELVSRLSESTRLYLSRGVI